jgi:hypothetical protein
LSNSTRGNILLTWLRCHPSVRDALVWAIPAVLFGAVLRWLLLSYMPYANWHADSYSYYSFADRLLEAGKWDLDEKRRFVYPMLLAPLSVLPGSTLKWVAWFQHLVGLLTLIPLAYCARKIFIHWRWWIIPVTAAYAALPVILWFEHELLAEAFFFAAFIWTMAGWLAWTGTADPIRRARLWWCFFIPFFLLVLTKPASRFIWPGVLFAMLVTLGWRWVRWREAICLVIAGVLTLMAGRESQGSRLLYTSAFPLTRLDTTKHAELKAEIRDLVTPAREALSRGEFISDRPWKTFLEHPEDQTERPLWQKLGEDEKRKGAVCRDLALEGIWKRPDLFLLIAAQRILLSANLDDFKSSRFDPNSFQASKFEPTYERYRTENPARLRRLFGLGRDESVPPFATAKAWLAPAGHEAARDWMIAYTKRFEEIALVHQPDPPVTAKGSSQPKEQSGPTWLGWWILAAVVLSFLPWYFRRFGVWVIISLGYLFGVFLVGSANSRFFAMVWSTVVLLLPLPLDALLHLVLRRGTIQLKSESGAQPK